MLPTSLAGSTAVGAVQFDDLFVSGLMMEQVDILGDDAGKPLVLFQPGQKIMGKGRLDGIGGCNEVT